jgi:hypothetical protein
MGEEKDEDGKSFHEIETKDVAEDSPSQITTLSSPPTQGNVAETEQVVPEVDPEVVQPISADDWTIPDRSKNSKKKAKKTFEW